MDPAELGSPSPCDGDAIGLEAVGGLDRLGAD